MNNTLNKLFIFAAGAAVGSVVTWNLVKTKYEQIAKDEIESVKEVLGRKCQNENDPIDDAEIVNEDGKDIDKCEKILDSNGYRKYSDKTKREEEEDDMAPYVIVPEAFEENDNYDVKTLFYYADGVLTDEHDNVIEDIESVVGEESLTHFGDYPDDPDVVYVRNELTMTDYEVLADDRKYSELYK